MKKLLGALGITWYGKDMGYFQLQNWYRWVFLVWFLITAIAIAAANRG